MAVDLKAECTRPLALLLAALAALGWVLFGLSSWSSASVQKAQRLQILDLTERGEKLSGDLSRQIEASGALADLQAKVGATREELTRVSQTRSDVQADLLAAQRNLSGARRELTEADRNLQSQSQKLADLQSNAENMSGSVEPAASVKPSRRGGRRAYRRRRR